jgi:RNA polymerase sigma factor FliA
VNVSHTLIEKHREYARKLARDISHLLPRSVPFEDLEGYALIGLCEAAADFDPTMGTEFTTFSYYRIRGAVFDGVRKMRGCPPQLKRPLNAAAQENQALAELAETRNDSPDPEWLAERLDDAIGRIGTIYLITRPGTLDGPSSQSPDEQPIDTAHRRDMLSRLRKRLAELEADALTLLRLIYIDGLSFNDLGQQRGVNKSTIKRQHDRILDHLRPMLCNSG